MPRHFHGCVCRKCKPMYRIGSNPPAPQGPKPLPPPNPPRVSVVDEFYRAVDRMVRNRENPGEK